MAAVRQPRELSAAPRRGSPGCLPLQLEMGGWSSGGHGCSLFGVGCFKIVQVNLEWAGFAVEGGFPPAGPLLPCLRALLTAQVWEGAGNPAHPLPAACSVRLKEARSSSALIALWRSGGKPRRLGTAFPRALARACFGWGRHPQLLPGAQLSTVSPGLCWRQQGEAGPFSPCCEARRAAVLLRCHGCGSKAWPSCPGWDGREPWTLLRLMQTPWPHRFEGSLSHQEAQGAAA